MAHCNSSLVHKPSYAACLDGKFQDLLPPRKRILAGLKHVKANAVALGLPTSTPVPLQDGEAHAATTTPPSPVPSCNLLLHSPIHKCFSCRASSVLLHRIPSLASETSYLCSSCVLSSNKKLYCVLCFQIINEGLLTSSSSASTFLTCCRCQRLTHLDCALQSWSPSFEGASLTLCKDCYARNNGRSRESLSKKQKIASIQRSKQAVVSACEVKFPVVDKQALTAAKIVAVTAKKEAFEAKQRATVLAKAAACAAAHAKAALDDVFNLSPRHADQEEHAGVVDAERKDQASVTTAKTPRGLKRRALSAIVASETLSRERAKGNYTATKEKPKRKQQRTIDGISSTEAAAEVTPPPAAQNVKPVIKRRKTLSSLTKAHAIVNSKGSKTTIKKSMGSSSSTKGKLGAIVSQVLALSRALKPSKAADKERGLQLHSTTMLDDGDIDGIQANASKLLMVSNDCAPSSGTITSVEACKPSHHGFVTSCGERIQDRKSFKEWLEYTDAMRIHRFGMIQEQLAKGRCGGCEAIGAQR